MDYKNEKYIEKVEDFSKQVQDLVVKHGYFYLYNGDDIRQDYHVDYISNAIFIITHACPDFVSELVEYVDRFNARDFGDSYSYEFGEWDTWPVAFHERGWYLSPFGYVIVARDIDILTICMSYEL